MARMSQKNKYSTKNLKSLNKSKVLTITTIVLLLVAAGVGVALYKKHSDDQKQPTISTLSESQKGDINFNAPTDQELSDTEQHKDDVANGNSSTPATTNDGKRVVNPVISSIDKTTAYGYVTGVFEEGGTCTITLTQGTKVLTKTSGGFENASYTQCAPLDLSSLGLSGNYTVTLSYSSPTSSGTSNSQKESL